MEQQGIKKENDEMEIDLIEVACTLLRRWKCIMISTLVCAVLVVAYMALPEMIAEPSNTSYTASTSVYYLGTYMDVSAQTSHTMETYFAGDLQAFAVSRAVVEGVIEDLSLDMTYQALVKEISVSITSNTHILTLSVTDEDATQAQEIAEALQLRFCNYVAQMMEASAPVELQAVRVTEQSIIGTNGSVNVVGGVLIGAALGLVLSIGCILLGPILFGFGESVRASLKKEIK